MLLTNENFNNTELKMEQQATRENSDYNQSVFAQMALYSALGTNAKFSQTNISMLFAMNMGDCRHHA